MVTEMGSSAVGGMSPSMSANAAKSFLEATDKEKKEMQVNKCIHNTGVKAEVRTGVVSSMPGGKQKIKNLNFRFLKVFRTGTNYVQYPEVSTSSK